MIIACGQFEALGDECPECGDDLNRKRPGGYPAKVGVVCSEDCAADQGDRIALEAGRDHLRLRDLLCDCAAYCAPAGLPTAAMHAEYARYVADHTPGK